MLKKIIKNELKSNWLEVVIVSSIIIILAFLYALTTHTKQSFIVSSAFTTLLIAYISGCVIVLINIISSFYKKMFSDEGYLTLTLPVTSHQLLIGKLISAIILIVSIGIAIILSVVIMNFVGTGKITDFIIINTNLPIIVNIIYILEVFFRIILLLVSLFSLLAILNCLRIRKFKILLSIILYYVLYFVLSLISNFATVIPFSLYYSFESKTAFFGISDNPYTTKGDFIKYSKSAIEVIDFNAFFWVIVVIIVLYFITNHIIKNKIELE